MLPRIAWSIVALSLIACSEEGIDSDEEARRAYLGLDTSIGKCLTLGFAGFNTASSANIDPQTAPGDAAGTLTINGQVDQGASTNKGMRLRVFMLAYDDGPFPVGEDDETISIVYDTASTPELQPALQLQLRDIPSGTFTGSLNGFYAVNGGVDGEIVLNLTMTGNLQAAGAGTERMPGSTQVTGTVTSGNGVYQVALTL
ncbi:MAG: hypothetical protein KBG48_34435 [Kofleriaceae bacterium]|jgi:hypothetical protein|nr:hypothetical protein [Kofleriaceae bacterium]MBP9172510.1 hypothetical protein [Kofleriaceae bacterium]MBP9861769.1 hypothetical protein [Kofleriaceae bacterium]